MLFEHLQVYSSSWPVPEKTSTKLAASTTQAIRLLSVLRSDGRAKSVEEILSKERKCANEGSFYPSPSSLDRSTSPSPRRHKIDSQTCKNFFEMILPNTWLTRKGRAGRSLSN